MRAATASPPCVPGAATPGAAPFILVTVFARGLLNRLFTRAYVPGEQLADDPLLASLPPNAVETLIASREDGRTAVRHQAAGTRQANPRRSSCAIRGIDRDRPVLAGR